MANETGNRAEARELAASRAAAYFFLSAAYFEEMPLGFLEHLRDEPVAVGDEFQAFARSLAGADLEQVRVDLAAEYARVFLGMSKSPVAPYESVYLSDLHILMQEPRDQVLREYRMAGYGVRAGSNLPEDHVAFELDFMGNLCQRVAEACASGNEEEAERLLDVQARFVEEHLGAWVPALVDDVIARVHTPFYRGVAEFTRELVQAECELLCAQAA